MKHFSRIYILFAAFIYCSLIRTQSLLHSQSLLISCFFFSLSEESKWVYVEYALGYSNPLNFFLNTNKLVDISPYFMQNATFQFKYDCVSHMNAGHVSLIANML